MDGPGNSAVYRHIVQVPLTAEVVTAKNRNYHIPPEKYRRIALPSKKYHNYCNYRFTAELLLPTLDTAQKVPLTLDTAQEVSPTLDTAQNIPATLDTVQMVPPALDTTRVLL